VHFSFNFSLKNSIGRRFPPFASLPRQGGQFSGRRAGQRYNWKYDGHPCNPVFQAGSSKFLLSLCRRSTGKKGEGHVKKRDNY
jgi:hypothetical protein